MRTLTPEQVVAEAADWYDTNYPGWWERVDLGLLNLWSAESCIAGQVLPGGWDALYDLEIAAPSVVRLACMATRWSEDRGTQFTSDEDSTTPALHAAWTSEVKRRFDEGRVA
jgi:hypothetical protein